MFSLLVIEDEKDIADLICFNLERQGYTTLQAHDGLLGLEMAQKEKPSLIILDQMLPGLDGQRVFKELKRDVRTQNIPVIFLTAKAQLEDKINGLELGADDYMTKPFSPKELLLRVSAVLKRCESKPGLVETTCGPFVFDKNALKFYIDKEPVEITATEFKLLLYMIERQGRILERHELLRSVWGYSDDAFSRTLDTHMKRVRQKLGAYGSFIETIRGVGYRFNLLVEKDEE